MRVTGTELNEFYRNWPFGDNWYREGGKAESLENGRLDLEPDEDYDPDEQIGLICWQGDGYTPRTITITGQQVDTESPRFLCNVFHLWREDSVLVSVRLPATDLSQLRGFIKERGWKIVT